MKRLSALTAAVVLVVAIGLLTWTEPASGEAAVVDKINISRDRILRFINECNLDDGVITADVRFTLTVVTVENKNGTHISGRQLIQGSGTSESGVEYQVFAMREITDPVELPRSFISTLHLTSAGSGDNLVSRLQFHIDEIGDVTVEQVGPLCPGN